MSKRFKDSREALTAIRNFELEIGNVLSGVEGEFYIIDINEFPESTDDVVIWAKDIIFGEDGSFGLGRIEHRFTCKELANFTVHVADDILH